MVWPEKRICEPGGKAGLLLPLTEKELELSRGVRATIYGVSMVYCFLGVSIAADIFMSSIEAITGRRRQKQVRSGKFITYKVWNETVANLSLMALGSSAPEIFLSVIDLLRNDFHAGELGPSTIVGSAAFNLFVIVAVCMLAIPSGDGRAVEQVPVFIVTAIFSLLAYVWLVVVVSLITPDIVTIWEAAVTFGFLPLLIWVSWWLDTHECPGFMSCCPSRSASARDRLACSTSPPPEAFVDFKPTDRRTMRASSTGDPGSYQKLDAKHEFIKSITAGKGANRISRASRCSKSSLTSRGSSAGTRRGAGCVQFLADFQSMSQNRDVKPVSLWRDGDLTSELRVSYNVYAFTSPLTVPTLVRTAPEAAKQWTPLLPPDEADVVQNDNDTEKVFVKSGQVTFISGADQTDIMVSRPQAVGCEDFSLELGRVETTSTASSVPVGPITSSQVKAIPTSSRGKIKFACERLAVKGKPESVIVQVVVLRVDGCSGELSCAFRTESLSALAECHYVATDGALDFPDGVTEARLELEVLPVHGSRHPKTFVVILDDPDSEEPAEFDPSDDGGEDAAILTVCIDTPPGKPFWRWVDRMVNLDSVHLGNADWYDSVTGVFFVNGSRAEQKHASCADWFFHLVALPWKVFFVFVPSTYYLGGWVCFMMALGYIAALTAIIADLADLFGCILDIPDMVTAITLVALGTSMPDLFASKGAAVEDPTADASIVNVTGSNSVNVFLGLGLPWTMGAVYWEFSPRTKEWEDRYAKTVAGKISGVAFVVDGSDLGFNVCVFSCCCVTGLVMLGLRRYVTGCELGGPAGVKYSTAFLFCMLWVGYIVLASWKVLRENPSREEELIVMAGTVGTLGLCCLVTLFFVFAQHMRNRTARPPKEVVSAGGDVEKAKDMQVDVPLSDKEEPPVASDKEGDEGPGEEGSVDIKPPLAAMEAPSGSRGRCFAKS